MATRKNDTTAAMKTGLERKRQARKQPAAKAMQAVGQSQPISSEEGTAKTIHIPIKNFNFKSFHSDAVDNPPIKVDEDVRAAHRFAKHFHVLQKTAAYVVDPSRQNYVNLY